MYKNAKRVWPAISKSLNGSCLKPKRQLTRCLTSFHPKTYAQPLLISRTFATATDIQVEKASDLWTTYCDRIDKNDSTLTAKDFNEICKTIIRDDSLQNDLIINRLQLVLRHIHGRVHEEGMTEVFCRGCNMLMHSYVSKGDLKSAKMVFEGMINAGHTPSAVSASTILYGIEKYGTRSDVYQFIQLLEKKDLVPNSTAYYSRLIHALKNFQDWRGCRHFFSEMVTKELDTDELSYKTMLSVYKASKQPAMALTLFNQMKEKGIEPSLGSYSYVISALSMDKSLKQPMEELFNELRQSNAPINVSIYLMMNWDPMEALVDMKKSSLTCETRDYNACLASYVKKNKFSEALEVFKMMNKDQIEMDVYSYTILIDALARDTETPPKTVFDLYEDMKKNGILADVVSYTSLMTACNRAEDLDKAMSLLEEMQAFGVTPNIYTFNSLLNVVANMAGRSLVDLDRATLMWSKMTSMGIQPDTRTFNIYLSILSKLTKPQQLDNTKEVQVSTSLWGNEFEDSTQRVPRTVKEMLKMYRYMRRHNNESMHPDFVSYTIVINTLSAAGQLRSAMQIYGDAKMDRVILPVAAYNEIIAALQRGGKLSEAMNVWHDMRLQSVLPDSTTYELILEGCEQLGLADSLQSIRNQRKLDFQRLLEIDRKKTARMAKAKGPRYYDE